MITPHSVMIVDDMMRMPKKGECSVVSVRVGGGGECGCGGYSTVTTVGVWASLHMG